MVGAHGSSSAPTSWATTTAALYNESNLTADSTDGWRITVSYTSPYSLWETSNLTAYTAGNTTSGPTDGWQTTNPGGGTWTPVDQTTFNLSNVSGQGEADGFRTYVTWAPTTQALYDANNTASGEGDNWRTSLSSTGTWSIVTQAQYNAGNTNSTESDGWRSVKAYSEPYTNHDSPTNLSPPIKNYATIGNLVVDNTSGCRRQLRHGHARRRRLHERGDRRPVRAARTTTSSASPWLRSPSISAVAP